MENHESIRIYRSLLGHLPEFAGVLLLAMASVYVSAQYPSSVQYAGTFFGFHLTVPFSAIFPVLALCLVLHRLYDEYYVIDDAFARVCTGNMSLRKREFRVELAHIHGIDIERGFLGRILNYGDVRIEAMLSGDRIFLMRGVRDPSKVRDILLEHQRMIQDVSMYEAHMRKTTLPVDYERS